MEESGIGGFLSGAKNQAPPPWRWVRPWILERRNGIARGIYNRLIAEDRYPGRRILAGVEWRLNIMVSAIGYSVSQLVFGSNVVDIYGWGDQDEDLLFAQDASASGRFARQWELFMMAQEAALKEVASSKLRRFLAYNETFNCTDVAIGDIILCYEAPN